MCWNPFWFSTIQFPAVLHGIVFKGNVNVYLWKSISLRLRGLAFFEFKTRFYPTQRLNLFLEQSKDAFFFKIHFFWQTCKWGDIQTFSLCRCGFRTEGRSGGKESVLVRCSRSEHISQQLTSFLFWRVLRTMHRYRKNKHFTLYLPTHTSTLDCTAVLNILSWFLLYSIIFYFILSSKLV